MRLFQEFGVFWGKEAKKGGGEGGRRRQNISFRAEHPLRGFRGFSGIFSDFQRFSEIFRDFQRFSEIFRDFQEFNVFFGGKGKKGWRGRGRRRQNIKFLI